MNAGIHDIPAESYHSDPCERPSLSASVAKLLVTKTPRHAWWAHPRLNPAFERVEEQKFDLGNVAHQLLLERSEERVHVVEAGDWRKKDAQEERDAARAAGMVPLLRKDWERVAAMVDAVRAQLCDWPVEPPLLVDGRPEQTLVWEEGGVECRALVDWLHDDFTAIDDLKTTARSANPVVWSRRTMIELGCDVQAEFNRRGVRALTGKDPAFRYVVVENEPPYALSVVAVPPSLFELGRAKVDFAIGRWRECVARGEWPGYPRTVYQAEAPAWAETAWMEFEAEVLTA